MFDFLSLEPEIMSPLQIGFAVFTSFLSGILASLTPCIYPMIPITVSVIMGTRKDPSRVGGKDVFYRSLSYVLGMALVYALLGVLSGLTGRVFGAFIQNSHGLIILGGILSFSALNVLDVISIDFRFFSRRFYQTSSSSSSCFILGLSSGFIAAPCTTPFLASILAYIAHNQSLGVGFALMFSFSLGLGTLLLVVSFLTGLGVQRLPPSGRWMRFLKIVSGLILLAFADYFIYRAGLLGDSL